MAQQKCARPKPETGRLAASPRSRAVAAANLAETSGHFSLKMTQCGYPGGAGGA